MKNIIKLNERELHKLISESVKRVLNEGGKWLGDFSRENISYLEQDVKRKFMNGEESVSFNLNGMGFTIETDGQQFYFSSGQYPQGGKGRALSIENAIKYCWQMSQR